MVLKHRRGPKSKAKAKPKPKPTDKPIQQLGSTSQRRNKPARRGIMEDVPAGMRDIFEQYQAEKRKAREEADQKAAEESRAAEEADPALHRKREKRRRDKLKRKLKKMEQTGASKEALSTVREAIASKTRRKRGKEVMHEEEEEGEEEEVLPEGTEQRDEEGSGSEEEHEGEAETQSKPKPKKEKKEKVTEESKPTESGLLSKMVDYVAFGEVVKAPPKLDGVKTGGRGMHDIIGKVAKEKEESGDTAPVSEMELLRQHVVRQYRQKRERARYEAEQQSQAQGETGAPPAKKARTLGSYREGFNIKSWRT